MAAKRNIEEGTDFTPKFDSNGLITTIAQDAKTGQVLMAAFMNRQALDLTIQTGFATYFSTSRQKLWKKGEESGQSGQRDGFEKGNFKWFGSARKIG